MADVRVGLPELLTLKEWTRSDELLLLFHAAESRGQQQLSATDVKSLFDEARSRPGNLHRDLAVLEDRGLLLRGAGGWRLSQRGFIAAEQLLENKFHRALKIADRHIPIHIKALDLMECGIVGRIRIIPAVNPAWHYDSHGRLLLCHHANLDRGSMRAQKQRDRRAPVLGRSSPRKVERILRIAGGMVGGCVQRVKTMILILDLRPIGDHKPNFAEAAHYVLGDLRQRMEFAQRAAAARQREISRFVGQRRSEFQFAASFGQGSFELLEVLRPRVSPKVVYDPAPAFVAPLSDGVFELLLKLGLDVSQRTVARLSSSIGTSRKCRADDDAMRAGTTGITMPAASGG